MDLIAKTRELGKMIQQEESFVNLKAAEKNADADQTLQDLIKEFNFNPTLYKLLKDDNLI
jgi:cell fate (sporulation/competence/biofilm development) regulator YlbF (YheA/YmcA/DUF963 family)